MHRYPNQQYSSQAIYFLMSCFAFVLPAASVNWSNVFYLSVVGMLVVSLWGVFRQHNSQNMKLTRAEQWLLASWLFYPAYAGLSILIRGPLEWGFFQESSRFLLIIPVFFTIRLYGLSYTFLRWGVVAGAIVAGLWAYYQKVTLGIARPYGGTSHVAAFGNIALLLGIISIALWQPLWSKNKRWLIVPLIALLFGGFASFASGNKGGWISLPFLIWLAAGLLEKPTFKKRALIMLVLVIVLGAVILYSDSVRDRLSVLWPAIYEYFVNGKIYDGSAGTRLALWHGSLLVFLDNPLLGVGFDAYREAVKPYIESGQVAPIAGIYGPHNQPLDSLVIFGWIGPVMVFGIYLSFMLLCQAHMQKQKALAIAGLMLAVGYIDFGLVEFVWYRNNMGVFFTFMMATISGLLIHYNNSKASELG